MKDFGNYQHHHNIQKNHLIWSLLCNFQHAFMLLHVDSWFCQRPPAVRNINMTFLLLFVLSNRVEVQTHDFLNNAGSKKEREASNDGLGLDLDLKWF